MCASRSSARSGRRRTRRSSATLVALAAAGAAVASVAGAATLTPTSKQIGAAGLPVTITTASIVAVADAYADQASPGTNSGAGTTLSVQSATSATRRAFVRFDLSSIPTTARVQNATLQLTMSTAPTATRTYEVDKVAATWTETGLTWSNMPSAAAATATVVSGTTSGVN